MTTTAATATRSSSSKYFAGQSVEVFVTTFTKRGALVDVAHEWVAGVVTEVSAREGGLFDVQVRTALGTWAPQIVGRRGGNSQIRVSA